MYKCLYRPLLDMLNFTQSTQCSVVVKVSIYTLTELQKVIGHQLISLICYMVFEISMETCIISCLRVQTACWMWCKASFFFTGWCNFYSFANSKTNKFKWLFQDMQRARSFLRTFQDTEGVKVLQLNSTLKDQGNKGHQETNQLTDKNGSIIYCKTRFFVCPLFREPNKFAKITSRENLNTVAFQCSNYGVQNN